MFQSMNRKILGLIISFSLLSLSCSNQNNTNDLPHSPSKIPNVLIQIEGKPHKGYLLGIEPYLEKEDYLTEDTFYQLLKFYLDTAKKEELLQSDRTILIFPEYIGTWLVASGENQNVFKEETINAAMETLVFNHLIRYIWTYLFDTSYAKDKTKETLFRMKALRMAETYQNVFSKLASEYRVGIVAGSIVLPEPKVVEGKITISDGPLQNVSFYFDSTGVVHPNITRKQFLIEEEKSFLSKENLSEDVFYNTSLGNLKIMICADSWYPNPYESAIKNNVTLIAIPSLVAPSKSWDEKWNGYNGEKTPSDVNKSDVHKLTEYQAWQKYALLGKAKKYKIPNGMNIFFRGKIWDLESTGDAFIIKNEKSIPVIRKKEKGLGRIYAIGI